MKVGQKVGGGGGDMMNMMMSSCGRGNTGMYEWMDAREKKEGRG